MFADGYIRACDLVKSYATSGKDLVTVLDRFSLSVRSREILALHGPNGCGKTTILNIIAQLIPSDGGQVFVDGKPPVPGDVGCLFQDYRASLFPWMTCAENIAFAAKVKGKRRHDRLAQARECARILELTLDVEKYPYQLSGGQQQLVALARALCNSPSALVMDEPFSSLDATTRDRVRTEVLRIIGSMGITAILVSHNLEDCILAADRIAFLTPLPARIHKIEDVPLAPERHTRRVHSDEFAVVLDKFRGIAVEAWGS